MLGARIAALRQQAGMNQRTLAKCLRVSPSTIGMYEQGRREPSAGKLVEIARTFRVSTDFLLTGTPGTAQDAAAAARIAQRLADMRLCRLSRDGRAVPLGTQELASLFSCLFD